MVPSWLVVIWAPPVNRQNYRKTWLKTLPFHKIHIRVVKNVNSLETLTQFNFPPRLNYFLCQLLSKCLTSNNIYLNISHYSTPRGRKEVGEHLTGLTALLNKGRLPSLYLIKDLFLGFESQKKRALWSVTIIVATIYITNNIRFCPSVCLSVCLSVPSHERTYDCLIVQGIRRI